MMDIVKSPVNMDRESARKRIEPLSPHESRFEPFNLFPDIASKYSTVGKNQSPSFRKQLARDDSLFIDHTKENLGQSILHPDKEAKMKPLNKGAVVFDKQQSRRQREKQMAQGTDDREVARPDLYTHHANAIRAIDSMRRIFEKNRLSPNLKFDNQPPRDNSMYYLSDVSNLNSKKYSIDN